MTKSESAPTKDRASLFTVRFIVSLVLVIGGIAYLAWYYLTFDPTAVPPTEASPKAIGDLDRWNYAIGFGAIMLGLIIGAHPSTPLGRGRGVVVGMLGCFLIGLLWICTFYVFADDLSPLPLFDDLGQLNLMVGIAFMAVGFSFATKWE